ncbi:MAG: hypothetical protein JSS14_05355 [Proteobacteria bacterium]|nr:hypothetical protein [Pseudomonadota bacterium]
MLLSERSEIFDSSDWIFEAKMNGYRLMAHFGNGSCELRTRTYANATKWFPEIAAPLSRVQGGPFVVDGVACVLDDQGRSDFGALLDRSRRRRSSENAPAATYLIFDLLADSDEVLTALPLIERKARLNRMLGEGLPNVELAPYAQHRRDLLARLPASWREPECLVAKRVDSFYAPGKRSPDWVRLNLSASRP